MDHEAHPSATSADRCDPCPASILSELHAVQAAEIDLLRRLAMHLQHENQILQGPDTDALHAVTQEKNALLRDLFPLQKKRQRMLERAGLPADRSTFSEKFPALAASEKTDMTHQWERLAALTHQLLALNHLNGHLIELRLQFVQGALSTLLGEAAKTRLYGANGHSAAFSPNRSLVKA